MEEINWRTLFSERIKTNDLFSVYNRIETIDELNFNTSFLEEQSNRAFSIVILSEILIIINKISKRWEEYKYTSPYHINKINNDLYLTVENNIYIFKDNGSTHVNETPKIIGDGNKVFVVNHKKIVKMNYKSANLNHILVNENLYEYPNKLIGKARRLHNTFYEDENRLIRDYFGQYICSSNEIPANVYWYDKVKKLGYNVILKNVSREFFIEYMKTRVNRYIYNNKILEFYYKDENIIIRENNRETTVGDEYLEIIALYDSFILFKDYDELYIGFRS